MFWHVLYASLLGKSLNNNFAEIDVDFSRGIINNGNK